MSWEIASGKLGSNEESTLKLILHGISQTPVAAEALGKADQENDLLSLQLLPALHRRARLDMVPFVL
jgi:hypothetical protein